MGTFHPHGDQAIYDALVRLAQDFSVRYPLVDGQGNFGNVDGDNAAAMRYTESRLTEAAQALLEGLDENAVDFRPTYDGEDEEPVVLPAAFPNLLANGSSGIAVGMATSIPPHNLGELCAALIALIENPNIQDRTPAQIRARARISRPAASWSTTRPPSPKPTRPAAARFRVRARWEKEEGTRGIYQIVVTEIPYQVQKAKLIERIAELLEQKKLPLLDDIHDESAEDIRIVLTPKSRTVDAGTADGAAVPPDRSGSAHSAQHECARQGPGAAGDEPEARCCSAFVDHRREVLERRSTHRLEKIAARLEVLEGYLAVYLNLDKVIKIIRTEDEPKPKLMKAFRSPTTRPKPSSTCGCAPCASWRKWKSAREHDIADQGAEGAQEAARFRQS